MIDKLLKRIFVCLSHKIQLIFFFSTRLFMGSMSFREHHPLLWKRKVKAKVIKLRNDVIETVFCSSRVEEDAA